MDVKVKFGLKSFIAVVAILFAVLVFGIYGPGFEQSQFIYFQF